MDTQIVFQVSLVAAYLAGIVALFAPCCISYLFPAYLGSVFKERSRVLFMTFIFSLGIFVVMMPIVLGFKALQSLFFDLHTQTYILGGIFMLIVAFISLIGIKFPMPRLGYTRDNQKNDVVSTFTLGIFSGIASACCAPVLIGVVALSSFSPTLIQSLGVGAAYVLGMVTPLFLASMFLYKGNLLKKPILKKKITEINIGSKTYPVFVSNIVASIIFTITGIVMILFARSGNLGMSTAETATIKMINNVTFKVTELTNKIPGLDIIFVIAMGLVMYKLIRIIFNKNGKNRDRKIEKNIFYTCPMDPDVREKSPGICPKCGMSLNKESAT